MAARSWLLVFLPLFIGLSTQAQFFSWAHNGGGSENDLATDVVAHHNSIYAVGTLTQSVGPVRFQNDSSSVIGGEDIFLLKTDEEGSTQFFFTFGGPLDESVNAVEVNSDRIFMGGGIEGPIALGTQITPNSSPTFYLASFDTLGLSKWVFTPSATFSSQQAEINDIASSGNTLVAIGHFYDSLAINGVTYSGTPNVKTPFVIQLDTAGNFQWIKVLTAGQNANGYTITLDANGNSYIGGNFFSTLDLGGTQLTSNGKFDAFFAKISPAGNTLWHQTIASSEADAINTLHVEGNNLAIGGIFRDNITVNGQLHVNKSSTDGFYGMVDTSGSYKWFKKLGSFSTDEITTIKINNGLVAVGGFFNGSLTIEGQNVVNFTQTGFGLLLDTLGQYQKLRLFDQQTNQEVVALSFMEPDVLAMAGNFIGPTAFVPFGTLNTYGKKDFFIAKVRNCLGNIPAPLQPLGPTSFCQSDSVILVTKFAPERTFRWVNNGITVPGESDTLLTVKTPGNYRLIVNKDGCEDTSKSISVQVLPKPTVAIDPFPVICEGQGQVPLTTGRPTGGIFSGVGVVNNTFDPLVGVGTFLIKYRYELANGCADSAFRNLQVGEVPNVNFASLPTLCSFDTLYPLTEGSPSGGVYSGLAVFNGTFNSAVGIGSYDLAYTYTTPYGCTNTDSSTIRVDSLPLIVLPDLDQICLFGGEVKLDHALPVGGAYSGPAIADGKFDPTQTGLGTFFHSYSYTASTGCSNSNTATITVVDGPTPDLIDSISLCSRTPLEVGLNQTYASYLWEDGSTEPNLVVSGSELQLGGQYYSVTVTDDKDCPGSDSVYVEVDYCQTVNVFPNPAPGAFSIEVNSERDTEGRILLYSPTGSSLLDRVVALQEGQNLFYLDQFSNYTGVFSLVIEFDGFYHYRQVVLVNQF